MGLYACQDCCYIVMVIVDGYAHKHLSCNSVYILRKEISQWCRELRMEQGRWLDILKNMDAFV